MKLGNMNALTNVCALFKRNVDGCGNVNVLMTNYKKGYDELENNIRSEITNACAVAQTADEDECIEMLERIVLHVVRSAGSTRELKEKYPLCAEAVRNVAYVLMTKLATCSNVPLRNIILRTEKVVKLLRVCAEASGGLTELQDRFGYFGKNLTKIAYANAKCTALSFLVMSYPFEDSDTEYRKVFGESILALMEQMPHIMERANQVLDTTYDIFKYIDVIEDSEISVITQYHLYAQYWVTKTKFGGGMFYNSLIDMMWDPKDKVWVSDIRDEGRVIWHSSRVGINYSSFSILNPPVWEMNVEKLNDELARIKSHAA